MTHTSKTPVAKSLHTVTVIQQITRQQMKLGFDIELALDRAMHVLELAGRPDPYRLRDKASRLFK